MGDIIQFGGDQLPANQEDLTHLSTQVAGATQVAGSDALLRLLRDGLWVYGAGNTEIEEDSQWAINPYSFQKGYIAWHDSQVEGEIMVPASQALPPRSELPEATEKWDDQIAFHLQCINGDDKGVEVLFKTTSVGGKRAAGHLAQIIAAKASEGTGEVVPIVALEIDHYTHKKYGKIYTPVFKVLKWVAMGAAAPEEAKAEAEPEPKRRTRKRRS